MCIHIHHCILFSPFLSMRRKDLLHLHLHCQKYSSNGVDRYERFLWTLPGIQMALLMSFMLCLEKSMGLVAHLDIYLFVVQTKGIQGAKNSSLQSFCPTSRIPGICSQSLPWLIKISQRSMLFSKLFLMQSINSVSGIVYGLLKHGLQFFADDQNFTMSLKQRKNLIGLIQTLCLLLKPRIPIWYSLICLICLTLWLTVSPIRVFM